MSDKPSAAVVAAVTRLLRGRIRVSETGCIEWTGHVLRSGYGQIMVRGRRYVVHRLVYKTLVGVIPDGLVLDHLCRNKICANPTHLEPVTERTNILRGVGVAAANALKTFCQNGHPFDADNTYWRPTGGRSCRACVIDAKRRFRERRRAS